MKFNGRVTSINSSHLPHFSVLTSPRGWTPNDRPCSDQDKLQRHADSAHRGVVDPHCPACIDIQRRYGLGVGK